MSRLLENDLRNPNAWQPEQIALSFTTCPRQPAYFATTLASALLGDPATSQLAAISVAVDAPDLSCVGSLGHYKRVLWAARTEGENERVASFHLHRRASHNYCRALAMLPSGVRALLVCEDDLIFREGWLTMLIQTLNEMRTRGLEDFILAAHAYFNFDRRGLRRGTYYSSYPAHRFFGTQAMLYPALESAAIKDWIWNQGVMQRRGPYDILIGRWARERQHLYATRYSLMQHIGAQSTGLGIGGRKSPTFEIAWPALKENKRFRD